MVAFAKAIILERMFIFDRESANGRYVIFNQRSLNLQLDATFLTIGRYEKR